MLALIKDETTIVNDNVAEGQYFTIPEILLTTAGVDGWTYENYRLATIVEPPIPAGYIVASSTVELIDGVPTRVYTFASLEDHRAARLAALADKRWTVETGGIVFNGAPLDTDENSQNKIVGAVSLFDHDPDTQSVDWKAELGVWVTLDAATIKAVGVAVGRHVQACYSHERVLSGEIVAATDLDTLLAIDIDSGWPPNA